jgi:hypothetical protein
VWSTSERRGDLECSASVPLLPVPLPFAISARGCYFDSSLTHPAPRLSTPKPPEYYSLCDTCSRTMTLRCRGKSSDSATAGGSSRLLH